MQISHLFIDQVPGKGRGVFTRKAIKPGTTIEISPVIIMTNEDRKLLDQTLLHDYIFEWQPAEELMCCMALGWIPVYNHSYQANCEYFMDYENQTIIIESVRQINAGEELTINYNGDWDTEKPVWFDVK